jgi:hypothetical protein
MKKGIFGIILGLMFLGTLIPLNEVFALTISPPVKEMVGDPGETVNGMVKVYNETDQDITVYSSLSDFSAKEGEGGEPQLIETKDNDVKSLSSWIDVSKGPFEIKPLDWQNVVFQVKIPKDAEPGGHYAAIFFGPDAPNAQEGAVSLNYRAGSLVLLKVSGEVKEEGRVKEFTTRFKKKFFSHIPVNFELRVENKGNVHFKPTGAVEILNIFGGKITEISIIKNSAGGNVLPKSTRKYDITWGETEEKNIPQGFWNIARYQWKNFYIGQYKAMAIISMPKGQLENVSTSFWIIPWQLIIIIVFVLTLLYFVFRQYNKWIIRKAKEERKD